MNGWEPRSKFDNRVWLSDDGEWLVDDPPIGTIRLSDDNARLRALLERTATMSGVDGCIWCLAWQGNKHREDCAVFTADGKVR